MSESMFAVVQDVTRASGFPSVPALDRHQQQWPLEFWVLTSGPGQCHSWVRAEPFIDGSGYEHLVEGRSQCWRLHPGGSTWGR